MRRFLGSLTLAAGIVPFLSLLLWTFIMRWPLSLEVPVFSLNSWHILKGEEIRSLFESVLNAGAAALLSMAAAIMAARRLIFFPSRPARALETFFLFPALVPALCVVIAFHESAVFLFGSFLAIPRFLLYLFFSFPYAFRVIHSAYFSLELRPLMEEASMAGAGGLKIFLSVECPLLSRHLDTAFVFSYSAAYGLYLIDAFFNTGSGPAFSVQMAEYLQNSNRGASSVYTLIYTAAGLAVLFLPGILSRRKSTEV